MRLRPWLIGLAVLSWLPLSGCAALNEWLEGTVGEEEKKDGPTPEEELANQQTALAGSDPAKRKEAIGKLVGLKRDDANSVVIALIDDRDPAVASEVLSQLQTMTGFPEKTEDERQLDPEGYDQQLKFKQQVLTEGLPKLAATVQQAAPEARYGALIVLYNLTKPPVVPDNARDTIKTQAADALGALAVAEELPRDARLLAIETLVAVDAGPQVGNLVPLLQSPDAILRERVALAVGQTAGSLGAAAEAARAQLIALANDPAQPEQVRSRALLSLAALGTDQPVALEQPFQVAVSPDEADDLTETEKISPLEAYRTYAMARSKSPEAHRKLDEINEQTDQIATKAEEELAIERKKGYR